jgi:uncharacterized protein YsxB (DUF464 family)
LTSDTHINANPGSYLAIFRGKEGRMNAQIIRYLALNGPSLIYSVAKDLANQSETKVHYPTVNRRMHDLLAKQYVQKVGRRTTKAGAPADLYATTIRGDFAAIAGIPDASGEFKGELSPKEMRQLISTASAREGSPFALIQHILEDGQAGAELVDKELLPEIISCIRDGYLNLNALNDDVICSAFSSLVARRITAIRSSYAQDHNISKETLQNYFDVLMRSLEKTISPQSDAHGMAIENEGQSTGAEQGDQEKMPPVSRRWATDLRVFLKLPSSWFD